MYVLRLAQRASTGRPPARFIRGRRYPSSPRPRTFYTSRILTQAANPPSGPDSTPIGDNEASKPDTDNAAAEEQSEAAVANDDPDVLAQKLQKSRDASKRYSSALRRQQRGKKFQGLPPVHIPDWFLRKRIIRPEDLPIELRNNNGRAALKISVLHAESREQATCAIPVMREEDMAKVTSRLVRGLWGRRLDDQEVQKVDAYLTERVKASLEAKEASASSEQHRDGTSNEKSGLQSVERNISADGQPPDFRAAAEALLAGDTNSSSLSSTKKPELAKLMVRLQELESELDVEGKKDALTKQRMKITRWMKKNANKQDESAPQRRRSSSAQLSPLVLAEVRATIAASLSTLKSSGADSFPAAKTNLVLHSSFTEHEKLVDVCVHQIAAEFNAEMIVLGAQDLAQLAGDYLGEGPEPSPRSVRSLGYETYRLSADANEAEFDLPDAAEEEWETGPTPGSEQPMAPQAGNFHVFPIHLPTGDIASALRAITNKIRPPPPQGRSIVDLTNEASNEGGRSQSQSELQLEDMKIANLLEALIDAGEVKQSRGLNGGESASSLSGPLKRLVRASKAPGFFDYSVNPEGTSLQLNSTIPLAAAPGLQLEVNLGSSPSSGTAFANPKIIYVKDFKEMNATHYGGRIIQKLEELVRKRRLSGESIMIVGSTCSLELTPELSASGVHGLQSEGESSYFRTIVTDVDPSDELSRFGDMLPPSKIDVGSSDLSPASRSKHQRINLSHIREMLRSLDPVVTMTMTDLDQDSQPSRAWMSIFPDTLQKRVLTYDEIHRLALTALGLFRTSTLPTASAKPDEAQMNWAHVALAIGLIKASDMTKYAAFTKTGQMMKKTPDVLQRVQKQEAELDDATRQQNAKNMRRQAHLQQLAQTATKYEKRLMPGIADPDQIKTTFDQVHVPVETIDSIRTITSLALLRPDAFSYGILATEKISGALLYGPPGTGKTMLAKAVAKESGSTVLEVSGSQIMDKYVGEGEKNVAAIFSLARKLSPCIVFLDEADAVFSSRDSKFERNSHRDILNQFLKEWDGLNDLSVFVMVATNRPFDLDDAVIRRLPRRLLVDLPTQADRKEILRIHLRDEQLDESVDLEDLAKRTPFYSGSDLKNVAVAAALTCVKEENAKATTAATSLQENLATLTSENDSPPDNNQQSPTSSSTPSTTNSSDSPKSPIPSKMLHLIPGQRYNFPERRILNKHHFDQALHEITASISEDMTSLNAIKKFDEQYGDRKGKKRRKDFGFGVLAERNESAARVRV